MTTCRLSELISPAFQESHRAVKSGAITELVEKGGRGSCKSSFLSVELILLLLKHPDCHAVVLRKVGNTLRTSVYAQICWAIAELGLSRKFKCTFNPMECTYLETGQKILFFGLDDPGTEDFTTALKQKLEALPESIAEATTEKAGLLSAADKTRLDGIRGVRYGTEIPADMKDGELFVRVVSAV